MSFTEFPLRTHHLTFDILHERKIITTKLYLLFLQLELQTIGDLHSQWNSSTVFLQKLNRKYKYSGIRLDLFSFKKKLENINFYNEVYNEELITYFEDKAINIRTLSGTIVAFDQIYKGKKMSKRLFTITNKAQLTYVSDLFIKLKVSIQGNERLLGLGKVTILEINTLLKIFYPEFSKLINKILIVCNNYYISNDIDKYVLSILDTEFDALYNKGIIDTKLYKKIKSLVFVNTIFDFIITNRMIVKTNTISRSDVILLINIINKITNEPSILLEQSFVQNTLPVNFNSNLSLFENLSVLIKEYLILTRKKSKQLLHTSNIIEKYYFTPSTTLRSLALELNMTAEGIRQCKITFNRSFKSWLVTGSNQYLIEYKINESLRTDINELFDTIRQEYPTLIRKSELIFLLEQMKLVLCQHDELIWRLLCDTYNLRKANRRLSHIAGEQLYITDEQIDQKLLLNIATTIALNIGNTVTPLSHHSISKVIYQLVNKSEFKKFQFDNYLVSKHLQATLILVPKMELVTVNGELYTTPLKPGHSIE